MRTLAVSLGSIFFDAVPFIELILEKYKNYRIIFVVESSHENRKALASAGPHHEEKFSITFEKTKNFYREQTEILFPKNSDQKEFIDIWIKKYFDHMESLCFRIQNENERYEWISFHLDKLQSVFLHSFLNSRNETAVYKKGQKFLSVHNRSKLRHARIRVEGSIAIIKREFFTDIPPDTDTHIFVTEGGVGIMSGDRLRSFSSQGSDVFAALIAITCEKEKTEVLFVKEKKDEIVPPPHEEAIYLLGKSGITHTSGTVENIRQHKMSSSVV